MKVSEAGLAFIATHEGTVLRLYNDPAGHCTVGIGHLVHHGRCDGRASEAPFAAGITREAAIQLLRQDVVRFERTVDRVVTVPLNQNQFDALVSFSFNVGDGAFRDSTLLKELNAGRFHRVRPELMRWTKSGTGEHEGLRKRRAAEADLFEGLAGGTNGSGNDELNEEQRKALGRIDRRTENLQNAIADMHPEVPNAIGRVEDTVGRVEIKLDELLQRIAR